MSINATIASYPVSNEVFLRAIFGNRWGEALVAYFPGDPRPSRNRGANFTTYPASTVLAAMSPKFNNYYDIALPAPGGTSHKLADFGALCAIVVDDIGTKVPLGVAQQVLGMASYLLETSPANYQAGWICDPITDRAWANGMLRVLHAALGADNLKKITTLVRLPVGVNGKVELGPAGFPCELVQWHPQRRITQADWIGIEQRIGRITPSMPRVSLSTAMPDPAEIEADPILKVFRDRGMVLGLGREMTFGWGFEVTCPWAGDHSDPRTEAGYVPVKGRFKCHHGHCQDRTMDDVRAWADAVIREDSGGLETLASQDFDVVDPTTMRSSALTWTRDDSELPDPWSRDLPPVWPGTDILLKTWEADLLQTARMNSYDPFALKMSYLNAVCGALDKRARFQPYARKKWTVPPIIWVVLLAISGSRKSSIWRQPLEGSIIPVNGQRMDQWKIQLAAWKALPPAVRRITPEPRGNPLLINDATIEALQRIMAHNPRGLHYARDELSGLLEFDRYQNGGKGHSSRAFLLESYEGGAFTATRIGRGDLHIDPCGLSMGGSIQINKLAQFKDLTDDGLHQRCSWIVLQDAPIEDLSGPAPSLAYIDDVIKQLIDFIPPIGAYTTDAAGEASIRATELRGTVIADTTTLGSAFKGVAHKLHGLHARLALILHLIEDRDNTVIPANTVERAGRLAGALIQHAALVHSGLPDQQTEITQLIASYLIRFEPKRLTTRMLQRSVAPCRSMNTKALQAAVEFLVNGEWLKPVNRGSDNRAWLVRPKLGTVFAARRREEEARCETAKVAFNWLGKYR